MPTRLAPYYVQIEELNSAGETSLASTLTSQGATVNSVMIYNTTLNKTRIWNGSSFIDAPKYDPDGAPYSAAPLTTVTNTASTYRNILECSGSHIAARVAGTYGIGYGDPLAISGTGILYPLATIYITSSDFQTVNGVAPKLRIRAQLYVNDVAPTGNFTLGLYPITRPATSGGTGVNIYTLGTVVTGSNGASFTTPAADSMVTAAGSDFSIPADGHYVIGVVTTQTVATNSLVHISAQLQLRNS